MRKDWMALHDWLQMHADPAQRQAWNDAAERARKHREVPVDSGA